MSNEQEGRSTANWWIAALGTCAVACTYFVTQTDLGSSRPRLDSPPMEEPLAVDGMVSAYSRMWEDPFEFWDLLKNKPADQQSGEKVPTGPVEAEQLSPAPLNPRTKAHDVIRDLSDENLHVLAVLIPGGPYPEDTEDRKRANYAVWSALSSAGYEMTLRDRITAIKVHYDHDILGGPTPRRGLVDTVVPIKLFELRALGPGMKPAGPKRLIVVWLNETLMGANPLRGIANLLADIWRDERQPNQPLPQLSILGPQSSDALVAMYNEVRPRDTQAINDLASVAGDKNVKCILSARFQDITLYSPRATVAFEEAIGCPAREMSMAFQDFGVRLVRTIGTDLQLVGSLREELSHRRAWPTRQKRRHVVLIAEKDSLYGRSLTTLLEQEIKQLAGVDDLIHVFTYFRGIDGRTRKRPPTDGQPTTRADAAGWQNALFATASFTEPPEGPSQRDYLRRLELQLLELQNALRRHHGEEIAAVGVVGTDIYDKLLVLKALRSSFPGAVFFTTDLDARYAAPGELRYTRNLIVASHFELTLNNRRLHNAPLPFRDSYQTSLAMSALLALKDPRITAWHEPPSPQEFSNDPWDLLRLPERPQFDASASTTRHTGRFLKPLVFEVGLDGFHQLTRCPPGETVNHYLQPPAWVDRAQVYGWKWWAWFGCVVVLFAVVVGMLAESVRRLGAKFAQNHLSNTRLFVEYVLGKTPREQFSINWFTVFFWLTMGVVAALLICIYVDQRDAGEPFAWFSGTSVWPSVLLMVASITLCGAVMYWASKETLDLDPYTPDGQAILASDAERLPLSTILGWSLLLAVSLELSYATAQALWGSPAQPTRGALAHMVTTVVVWLAELLLAWLSFLVVALVRQCWKRIDVLRQHRGEIAAPEACYEMIKGIEQDTADVVKTTWWPFVIGAMLIAAHSGVFDNWGYPLAFILFIVFALGSVTVALWTLRRRAAKARRAYVDYLAQWLIRPAPEGQPAPDRERVKAAIDAINSLRDGAFRPWADDPVFWTLTLPFGSSAVVLVDALSRF